jgi:LuxR family maltose regulon positive regulatory protein
LIDQYPPLDQVETLPDYLLLSSTQAQWLLTQGQPAACAELLAARYEKASRAGVQQALVETRALQALAAPTHAEALSFLNEALMLAEPEGYIRTFVDLGEPMAALLREAAAHRLAIEYIGRLLAAFRQAERKGHTAPPYVQPLVEPLSEREIEVLRLVAAGLSNSEIAKQLIVSPGTVKSHVHNIYGKLEAHNRAHAVARARELHLI